MLKKIFIALVSLIVLIVLAIIILPQLFKEEIFQAVKDSANEQVNATLDFGDFSVSIFENFPDFTLSIENVKVTGIDTFAGVELANIPKLVLTVDIMKAIGGEYEVKSFGLLNPSFHVKVLPDGTANYDIAIESGEEEEVVEEKAPSTDSLALSVQEYFIEGMNLIYDDLQTPTYAEIVNLTHRGSVKYRMENANHMVDLSTTTISDAITVKFDGVRYLNKVKTDITFNVDVNVDEGRYIFKENSFKLNALDLGLNGSVVMPDGSDDIGLDIQFDSKQTTFKSILSLVPGIYTADFADVDTDGKLSLSGMAKGTYADPSLPAFDLQLKIDDARFHYPDLPKGVEDIQVDLRINNPGGSEDNTVIDLKMFHMEMAGNPVDMTLLTKTPISDPYIEATVQTQMNLASLAEVIPMEEGEAYQGDITANLSMKGYQSAIDSGAYDEFEARGDLILLDFDYKSPELPYTTNIKKAYLKFSPEAVELSSYEMTIGKSDIQANGKIENFIAYYLTDDPLTGEFNMTSNLLDLNEFMGDEEEEVTEETTEEEPLEIIEVPGNIDFVMMADLKTVLYDTYEMKNMKGGITIRESKVSMDKLAMDMMGGSLEMSGSYATVNPEKPTVDFYLDIANWDVEQSFNSFNTIQKLAPVGERAEGAFSCKTSLVSALDENMEADLNTLTGKGEMLTHNVTVKNTSGALAKVGELMKSDEFDQLKLDNVKIAFFFENGKINIKPFDMKLGKESTANVSGNHSFDGALDYVMQTEVPSGKYGELANELVSGALGDFFGGASVVPENLLFDVLIGGTQEAPKVSLRPAGGSGSAAGGLKDQIDDKIEEVKEEVKEKVEEKIEDVKEDLKAKRDAIMAEGEKRAKKAKKVAKQNAEKARKEGYAQADAIEKKAKNPIAKKAAKISADKVRKETDKKADAMIVQGDKKADQIMAGAKKKAAALK